MPEEPSVKDMVISAKQAEAALENESAIALYEKIIKTDPLNEFAYDRLMILFRKTKNSKREIGIIKLAVNTFEKFYKSKLKSTKKISEISNRLNRSIGLVDKKGQSIFDPEPIAKWKKRKMILEKKN